MNLGRSRSRLERLHNTGSMETKILEKPDEFTFFSFPVPVPTRYWVYFFKHHRAKISLFALTRQMSTCLLYFVNAVPSSAICYQFSPRIHSAASLLPGHPRHACDPGYGPPVAQARCWPQRQEPVWRNPAGALCLLRQRGLHQTALGVGSTFRFIIYSNAGNS